MANTDESGREVWRSRPWAARAIRVTVAVLPFLVATIGAWRVHLALGQPPSLLAAAAQWLLLSLAAMGAIRWMDRGVRRLLPLAALMQMSLAFPEEAPSRFGVAIRRGTTRQLERDAESGSLDDSTPQEAAEHLLGLVAELSTHDRRTRGHTERVRAYADMIAEEMSLSEDDRRKLHWAALIHDIGKLRVPAEILAKSGEPNPREWAILEAHAIQGWRMLGPLRIWLGEWAKTTRDHHERWDGSGYPRGLVGEQISQGGRIVAVADAYDVMTAAKSYKTPITPEAARAELTRCAGTQFDPAVVRAFLAVSLRHERAAGPLASLAQSPVLLRAGSLASVPGSVASGAVAATIAAGSLLVPVGDDTPVPRASREVALDEVATTTTTTTQRVTTTTTTTTTSTTTTTTTLAPATTIGAPAPTGAPASTGAPSSPPPSPPPTTTLPPPTTTAGGSLATIPPTTTAPPPPVFENGFLGGGTSGAPLVTGVGGSGAVDWDSDSRPGLTLPRHPDGLIELDAPHVQAWTFELPWGLAVDSSTAIDLWVAAEDFDPDALGVVIAGMGECTRPTSGCTTIATGTHAWLQSDFGADFGRITLELDATPTVLAPGNHLVVSIAAPPTSMRDVWIAFGSGTHPSVIRL